MLIDFGVIDHLVGAAFSTISSSIALYVPHGRPQPSGSDNSSNVPWFFHRMKFTSEKKTINPNEPDKGRIQLFVQMFCPGQSIINDSSTLYTAIAAACALVTYQRFVDTPYTHELVLDGYDCESDYAVDDGGSGVASLLVSGSANISGFACRVA